MQANHQKRRWGLFPVRNANSTGHYFVSSTLPYFLMCRFKTQTSVQNEDEFANQSYLQDTNSCGTPGKVCAPVGLEITLSSQSFHDQGLPIPLPGTLLRSRLSHRGGDGVSWEVMGWAGRWGLSHPWRLTPSPKHTRSRQRGWHSICPGAQPPCSTCPCELNFKADLTQGEQMTKD